MEPDTCTANCSVEESNGAWYLLWWEEGKCVYSEELEARTRADAEQEARRIAETSSPIGRIMDAFGYFPTQL